MIKLAVDTKLGREQVLERARRYFAGDLGLQADDQGDCCVAYSGAGGFVSVSFEEGAPAGATRVIVEAREWEEDAKRFASQLS